jgi:LPXTG-site transpeptidase (sortase) family protein
MTRKRFAYYIALLCSAVVALLLLNFLATGIYASEEPPANQKDIEQLLSLQAAVDHLIIPRIKVNAVVDPVDTNASGAMAVVTNQPWEHVGWYANGPYPGEQGSAVIDGHLDRPGGFPAVFWNLRQLRPGDAVLYETPGQPLLHFRVTKVAYYTPAQAPVQAIFNNRGGRFLNLVTCAGAWIPAIHQTTLRLVVYTTLL